MQHLLRKTVYNNRFLIKRNINTPLLACGFLLSIVETKEKISLNSQDIGIFIMGMSFFM